MILAVLAVLLLSIIPVALVAATVGQVPQAEQEQQSQGALAAAQAGVSDYLNLLDQASVNQTQSYWSYDASNLPPDGDPAMTGWEQVSTSPNEYFHYSVDNTNTASSGVVTLTSTGVAIHGPDTQYQTVRVQIRSETFLNYVDMVNEMMIDPKFAPDYAGLSTSAAESECEIPWSKGGPSMPACQYLINYQSTGTVFNGALFSNDIYYISGNPIFNGPVYSASSVTSGNSNHPYWLNPANYYLNDGVYDDPQFNAGDIQYHAPLVYPSANASLESIAQSDGCYYQGPTSIDLTGTTMTVYSPESTSADHTSSSCPTDGTGPLPANGVLYVGADLHSTTTTTHLPMGDDNYPSADGDAVIQGDIEGQITVVAANDVDIAGNLLDNGCAQSGTSSVIGLIANNFVQVQNNVFADNHYTDSDGTGYTNITPNSCAGKPGDNAGVAGGHGNTLVVQAAILALNQSFAVQDFWNDPYYPTGYFYQRPSGDYVGNLDLDGSIAGYYADIEGSFGNNSQVVSGYDTIYTYDSRLAYMQPPYFLTPVAAQWQKISFTQILKPTGLPSLP